MGAGVEGRGGGEGRRDGGRGRVYGGRVGVVWERGREWGGEECMGEREGQR